MKNPRQKGLCWHGETNEDLAWLQYGKLTPKVDAVLTILRLRNGEELEVTIHDAEFALGKKAKAHLMVPVTIEVDLADDKFAAAEGHGIPARMTDGATGVQMTEDGAGMAVTRRALDHLGPKTKSFILKVHEESLVLPLTPDVVAALKAIYAKKKLSAADVKAIDRVAALPREAPAAAPKKKKKKKAAAPKKKAAAPKKKAAQRR